MHQARGLNHSNFRQFLIDVEAQYQELLYHTEVRWLSRGRILNRFFELLTDVDIFTRDRGNVVKELSDKFWIADLAFCCDLNGHLNVLNLRMQGRR